MCEKCASVYVGMERKERVWKCLFDVIRFMLPQYCCTWWMPMATRISMCWIRSTTTPFALGKRASGVAETDNF